MISTQTALISMPSAALRRYGVAQIVEAPQSRMAAMAEVIEQLLEGRADHAAGESESDR